MRLTLILFLLLFLPAGNNVFAISSIADPNFQQQTHTTAVKKQSLKEKILLKWYKKQLRKKEILEQPKKTVNTLGYLSLIAGLLAPLLILLAGVASYGLTAFTGILALVLVPTAIILGIISLQKRKKLQDKSGTSAVPAIIGLITGGAFVLFVLIALISFSISY